MGCDDGMDHERVETLAVNEGRLPNLAKLRAQGGFRPLTTSIPPQSPVAWSNFITGADPGVHGIFDFIHRDNEDRPAPSPTSRLIASSRRTPRAITGASAAMRFRVAVRARTCSCGMARRSGSTSIGRASRSGCTASLPTIHRRNRSTATCIVCRAWGVPDIMSSQGTYQYFTSRSRKPSRPGGGIKTSLSPGKDGRRIQRLAGRPVE